MAKNPYIAMFLDDISVMGYGIKRTTAIEAGICIRCKRPALEHCKNDIERKETQISGLCGKCWTEIMSEDDGE